MTYEPKSGVSIDVESACIVAAFDIAKSIAARLADDDCDPPKLTDEQKLALGFGMLADRYAFTQQKPKTMKCGWCVGAAGDDQAAWDAAESYDLAAIKAHTLVCQHNPLVVEIDRLRIDLADEERAADRLLSERDHRVEQLDDIADALGDEGEWSNLHDRGTAAIELAHQHARELERLRAPITMRLTCPECGELHIDEGEFATKPHHTHACQHCGNVWRPAIAATVGVRFLPGFKNEPPPTWAYCEEPADREFGRCSWNGTLESLVDGRCPNCGSSAIREGQP